MRLIDLDPETVALRDILVLEDGPFKIHLRALPGVWYMPAGGTTPAGFWCRRDGCGDRVTYGIPGSFFADKGSLDVHIGGNHTVWIRMESQWPEHGPTACQKCRTVVEGAAGMREHALYGGCPMQLWWVHHAPPDVDVGPIIESLGGWTWERLQALCVPGRKIKLSFGENTSPRVQYWLDKMATEGFPERRPSPDPYEDLWWKHWTPPIRVGPPPPGFGSL
ncbi:hypothetical protein DL93DRAFT_1628351 [Clavulina sp. PMI_390]|nr:hypothetical protein DL93DRAFT_1628351 [Clavulina sp. PMI_390]